MTGVLIPVGIYCVKIAGQRDHSALPVAAIPMLFGVQQFAEGLVWVGLGRGDVELTRSAALVYLFFALAFWLFWVPFSAIFLEQRKAIKIVLGIGAAIGLAGGATLYLPVVLNPVDLQVSVVRHAIYYDYVDPPAFLVAPQIVWHLFYLTVVSLPLILLKEKLLIGFSTAIVVSAVISHLYFIYAFASIWCFFAAAISIYLGYTFHHWPNRRQLPGDGAAPSAESFASQSARPPISGK